MERPHVCLITASTAVPWVGFLLQVWTEHFPVRCRLGLPDEQHQTHTTDLPLSPAVIFVAITSRQIIWSRGQEVRTIYPSRCNGARFSDLLQMCSQQGEKAPQRGPDICFWKSGKQIILRGSRRQNRDLDRQESQPPGHKTPKFLLLQRAAECVAWQIEDNYF